MKHEEASRIAEEMKINLFGYCEQIEIAGSVRRGSPEVKDIEIVAMPTDERPRPEFGKPAFETYFDAQVQKLIDDGLLVRKNNGRRYMKFSVLPSFIQLDLFIVRPPAQWGVVYVIRTGPADFSQWIVTNRSKGGALPDLYRVKDGAVWKAYDDVVPVPDEAAMFDLCGLPYTEPARRRAGWTHNR